MIVRRTNRPLGQLDPGVSAAITPEIPVPNFKLSNLFFISVAAGVTVWLITKWLNGGKS